jgi:hypothetical protein
MPVRENAYYWEYSLEYPEPEDLAEEAYIHDQLEGVVNNILHT